MNNDNKNTMGKIEQIYNYNKGLLIPNKNLNYCSYNSFIKIIDLCKRKEKNQCNKLYIKLLFCRNSLLLI